MQRKSALLPKSGAEPPYAPARWNGDKNGRETHNCYAYFLQDFEERNLEANNSFPQPGAYALSNKNTMKPQASLTRRPLFFNAVDRQGVVVLRKMPDSSPYRCEQVRAAVLADNPHIYSARRSERCAPTHYKGFFAVDSNADDSDYHFWIQNSDGTWSHKPGEENVRATDSDGNAIFDPLLSNRGRYDTACGYFCVPANAHIDTQSRRRARLNEK